MKKILISLMAMFISAGIVFAQSTVSSYSIPNLVSEINTALSNPSNTTITISGKSTMNGELEVNNSDVDINMTLTGNEIDITQTNATGTANVPLIKIDDDRTGATANTAQEATLVIDSAGTYALVISNGIFQVDDEIDTLTGDLLLDPTGGEVHIDGGLHVGGTDAIGDNNLKVDGTADVTGVATFTAESVHNSGIDADYITVDAAQGINPKTAGALQIGTNTATAINYGSASVTAHTFISDGTGTGEIVLPNESIGNAEIADVAATKVTAGDLPGGVRASGTNLNGDVPATQIAAGDLAGSVRASATNLNGVVPVNQLAPNYSATNLALGTMAIGIDLSMSTNINAANIAAGGNITAINGNSITNLNGANFGSSMTAANLTAGTIASAIDGSGITNIAAANVGTGYSAANLTAGSVMSAVDLSAGTNINGASIASGDIASARMTANAVVVSDFGVANDVLVGTGAGTFTTTTGSGALVITNATTISTNVMYFGAGGVLQSNVYTGP